MPAVNLLVACHDAGGAEIVSSWLRRRPDADAVPCLLKGPALRVFARKLGPDLRTVTALPPLDPIDLVLCGSSADDPLERLVVRAARAAGVRSAVWLDHWVNYAGRFVLDGELVLPDEVWVADEHAQRLAAETLPGVPLRLCGNPYLEDAAAEIHALEGSRGGGERILYVTQPTTVAARMATGDPLGWGYDERDALAGYLEQIAGVEAVRIRLHPAETADKYASVLDAFVDRLPLELSRGGSLVEDCAWADTVAGCDTMAMVVALAAGRRVVSVIPPGGQPLSLPFEEIERLY